MVHCFQFFCFVLKTFGSVFRDKSAIKLIILIRVMDVIYKMIYDLETQTKMKIYNIYSFHAKFSVSCQLLVFLPAMKWNKVQTFSFLVHRKVHILVHHMLKEELLHRHGFHYFPCRDQILQWTSKSKIFFNIWLLLILLR